MFINRLRMEGQGREGGGEKGVVLGEDLPLWPTNCWFIGLQSNSPMAAAATTGFSGTHSFLEALSFKRTKSLK